MKTKVFFIGNLLVLGFWSTIKAQDLTSISVGGTLPEFTYNSNSKVINLQMTVRNVGYFNSDPFDVAFFVKNVSTSQEYEVDRINYSGLSYTSLNLANTLYITNLSIDLNNQSQIPSGTYRVIAKINDNQAAYETNYNNNNENFGSQSFSFVQNSTTGLEDLNEKISVQVYPNPSSGMIQIAWNEMDHLTSDLKIEVYAINGQKIYDRTLFDKESQIQIDLSNQPKGVYTLHFLTGAYSTTKSILIN